MSKKSKKSKGFVRTIAEKLVVMFIVAITLFGIGYGFLYTEQFAPARMVVAQLGHFALTLGILGALLSIVALKSKGLGSMFALIFLGGAMVALGNVHV